MFGKLDADGVIVDNRMRKTSKKFSADKIDEEHVVGSEDFDAGEYYFVFMPSTNRTVKNATTGISEPSYGGYVFLKQLLHLPKWNWCRHRLLDNLVFL